MSAVGMSAGTGAAGMSTVGMSTRVGEIAGRLGCAP